VFPDCKICEILLEQASDAIRFHLKAMAALEDAVLRNQADSAPALARALITAREYRRNTMREYREHTASQHEGRQTMTAGGGP
jgi:hypothetical protein